MNSTSRIVSRATLARAGEDFSPPPRSNRFLASENYWFYRTREGYEVGPYTCRSDAEAAASAFAQFTARVTARATRHNLGKLICIHIDRILKQARKDAQGPVRDGEADVPSKRQPRIIHRGTHWFFTTREGRVVGPYQQPGEAKESAQLFTSFAKHISRTCVASLIDTMNDNIRNDQLGHA